LYVAAGIFIGVFGGMILSALKLDRYVAGFVQKKCCCCKKDQTNKKQSTFKVINNDAMGIFKKVAPYVILGVGVGALIHGYVPEGFFEKYIQADNLLAVPAAVILAIPLYANASGVIPIVESLVGKGIPLGTALAFMMAVVGLSLPEALILKKVMRLPLLIAFFSVVALGIILIGYGFNLIVS